MDLEKLKRMRSHQLNAGTLNEGIAYEVSVGS